MIRQDSGLHVADVLPLFCYPDLDRKQRAFGRQGGQVQAPGEVQEGAGVAGTEFSLLLMPSTAEG